MVRYAYAFVAMAGLAAALPLNINLGAYSPALVVGDGEISFGGGAAAGEGARGAGAQPAAAEGAAVAPAPVPVAGEQPVTQASADPALQQQAQQISALQGMGKEIAPRLPNTKAKRDIAGFDRALTYAEAALVKGPKVQLGTGAEGSGVGIIVDNNQQAAARAGTGKAEKRDVEGVAAKVPRTKVTTI